MSEVPLYHTMEYGPFTKSHAINVGAVSNNKMAPTSRGFPGERNPRSPPSGLRVQSCKTTWWGMGRNRLLETYGIRFCNRDGTVSAGPRAGSGCRVQGVGFRVRGSGFRVLGSGFRVQGSGFRVQGSGFRVQGSGFMGTGCGIRFESAI